MPRDSRPPGFDMTYRPERRQTFGPPATTWILPGLYVLSALGLAAFVVFGRLAPSNSWMFRYVVEQDANRLIGAGTLATAFLVGAIASVVRTAMRGVVVHPDGIEARYVLNLAWPRVKRYSWMEIDRMVFADRSVFLHLWDGGSAWLPPVRDYQGLTEVLERVAMARAIPLKGGSGKVFPDEDGGE